MTSDNQTQALLREVQMLREQLNRIEEAIASQNGEPKFVKEWFTVAQTAELLGRRPFTVREWARCSRISAVKRPCGRGRSSEWVFHRDAIEQYMNEGLLPVGGQASPKA
ncbi:MAG: helix-turn-helix domain-containing protein [Pirellulaceae bacterium]